MTTIKRFTQVFFLLLSLSILAACAGSAGSEDPNAIVTNPQEAKPNQRVDLESFFAAINAGMKDEKAYTFDLTEGTPDTLTDTSGAIDFTDPAYPQYSLKILNDDETQTEVITIGTITYTRNDDTIGLFMTSQTENNPDATKDSDAQKVLADRKKYFTDIEYIDDQVIEGVNTRHYQTTINTKNFLNDTNEEIAKTIKETETPFDVYLDNKNRLVKMEVVIPTGEGDYTSSSTFTKYGERNVEPPPEKEIIASNDGPPAASATPSAATTP